MAVKIKVFTFNLRVVSESDGINIFYNRKERILGTIANHSPELIGFQEVNDEMREWLKDSLSAQYELVGCGRNDNYRGESVLIAYKKNVFDAISYETFWLSAFPAVSGSRFYGTDQSVCPRTCVVVRLKHREAENVFSFYNTHLDHKGAEARLLGASQIMQRISMSPEKFILTGDMNALTGSPEIELLRTSLRGRGVKELTEDINVTFHGFGKANHPGKIDYIFTDMQADKIDCKVVEDAGVDGVYISDHNPVYAELIAQ